MFHVSRLPKIIVILAASLSSATCQSAPRKPDVIAEEISRRVICEAYTGASAQSVACDWPDISLESHLALMTAPEEAAKKPHLRVAVAVLRLKAMLDLPDYWKKELPLRAREGEASANAGLLPELEKTAIYILSLLSQAPRVERIRALSKELKALPEFKDLTELVKKVTQAISQELMLQPELLKRFADRPPTSLDLVKARNTFRAQIAK